MIDIDKMIRIAKKRALEQKQKDTEDRRAEVAMAAVRSRVQKAVERLIENDDIHLIAPKEKVVDYISKAVFKRRRSRP